jgi:hypothetical protein
MNVEKFGKDVLHYLEEEELLSETDKAKKIEEGKVNRIFEKLFGDVSAAVYPEKRAAMPRVKLSKIPMERRAELFNRCLKIQEEGQSEALIVDFIRF